MATVIGDFASDPSRFRHNMVFQPQQQSHHQQSLRSSSRPRDTPSSYRHPPSSASPTASTSSRQHNHDIHAHLPRTTPTSEQPRSGWAEAKIGAATSQSDEDSASRFPTPPDSSSPSASNSAGARPQHAAANIPPSYMDTSDAPRYQPGRTPSSNYAPTFSSAAAAPPSDAKVVPPSASSSASNASHLVGGNSIPSPASDSFPQWAVPDSPTPRSRHVEARPQQTTIRVRDLAHIQSLARADLVTGNGPGILGDPPLSQMKYEISDMPIGDIIEMVAALLTKITTTNDLQHDALNRNATHQRQAQQAQQQQSESGGEGSSSGGGGGSGGSGGGSPYANSVLAFHGKNVPAITILSYLSRIHKYCPTTFEVFLSLLVYFDRMTERVNELVVKSEQERQTQAEAQRRKQRKMPRLDGEDVVMSSDDDEDDADAGAAANAPPGSGDHESDETDEDLADSSDDERGGRGSAAGNKGQQRPRRASGKSASSSKGDPGAASGSTLVSSTATYFVVDSYNIHRLIIAGVTCASKFFSDVFYTNSRYAKVGGLPLPELNHLELQFLLLNDFRLAVPVEDLEAYATMLVEFYAREVVGQRSRPATGPLE